MSLILIERIANLNGPIIPDTLNGVLNGGEIDAHKFIITATRDGAQVALTGTVTASFLCADGAEVVLTGEIEDGAATVTLAQSCYAVPGRFDLTIFVTADGVKTGVYACTGGVRNTTSGTIVDPGQIVPSVDDIIAKQKKLAQDVADASSAIASAQNAVSYLAPVFSTSKTYKVGEYVTKDGALYICTTAVETAGEWDAAKWQSVTFGREVTGLKGAFVESNLETMQSVSSDWVQGGLTGEGTISSSTSRIRTRNTVGISSNVYAFSLLDGYEALVYAYNADDSAIGWYHSDGTFSKNTVGAYVAEFDFMRFPQYKFRLVIRNADTPTASIAPSAGENCTFKIGYIQELNKAAQEMDAVLERNSSFPIDWKLSDSGFINYNNGNVAANPMYTATDYVDVSKYASISFKRTGTNAESTSVGIAFYSANKDYLSGVQGAVSQSAVGYLDDLYQVVVPKDAKYVRFTTYADTTTYGMFALYGRMTAISILDNSADQRTYIVVGGWQPYRIINDTNGNLVGSLNVWMVSDYVDISAYNRLEFACAGKAGTTTAAMLAFYDINQNYISGYKHPESSDERYFAVADVPENAKYARFTYRSDYQPFFCYGRKDAIKANKHIRFFVFGNSYGCDSVSYVPFILKNMGITCDVVLYVRDACSIRDIYNRWNTSAARDNESDGIHSGSYQRFVVHIDTRFMSHWETLPRVSMADALALNNWDFVTIQQYSGYTMDIAHYSPWTELVMELIQSTVNRGTPLVYTHVWTRHAYDNPTASISTFEEVAGKYSFDWCIPCATAIFNARANAEIAQLGDSEYHNLWCDDNIHLQDGLPCYIAAGVIVESICRHYFPERSFYGDHTAIDTTAWVVPEYNGPVIGMTDENRLLAQKTVITACNHPFEIIPAQFTPLETYADTSEFPATGTAGVLYIAEDTGYSYTWNGTQYVQNVAN